MTVVVPLSALFSTMFLSRDSSLRVQLQVVFRQNLTNSRKVSRTTARAGLVGPSLTSRRKDEVLYRSREISIFKRPFLLASD